MVETKAPTPHTFAAAFREVIRVGLNWERFFEENWPIELVLLDSRTGLNRCFMPWYIGVKGDEVAYDDHDAVPMNLHDVPKALSILNEERREDILQKVDSLRGDKAEVIKFNVPTYALPDNQYFVLDRNHRLSALMLNSIPFDVTLWNIRGPLDPDCLLDLIHWVPPRKSATD